MLEFRRTKSATPETLIRAADGTVLARIPPAIAQEVQYLWTRLELHDTAAARTLGLTSQLSGEGVSFTARALAAMLALRGTTCLVESNWWGENLPVADVSGGLAGVLAGSTTLDDALVSTSDPSLSILPAGPAPFGGTGALPQTDAMAELLDRLRQRFDHTIIDLPAISTSAISLNFAAEADATLLVVRHRVTRVDQVESAIGDLRHTRLVGVVLNDTKLSMPKFLQRRLLSHS
ncbi:MAG: hypothetical protein AAGA93_05115 [Actinomycetota bacterium]